MTSVQVFLKSVESKVSTTGKSFVKLTGQDGGVFSVWADPSNKVLYEQALGLKPGMLVMLSFKQNGVYRNVEQIVVSESVSAPAQAPAGVPSPFNDRRERRISRLAVLNASIEFHKILVGLNNNEPTEKSVLELAERFEKHVYRGMDE